MMEEIILRGRGAYNGVIEGEALVLPDSVQGWAGLDEKTGIIIEEANCKHGAYIGGKILVLPCAKGSNGWASHFYSAKVAGHCPTAWIIQKLDSRCAACIVELGIPAVVETTVDPFEVIHDGDIIRVDGTNGIVTMVKRKEA